MIMRSISFGGFGKYNRHVVGQWSGRTAADTACD